MKEQIEDRSEWVRIAKVEASIDANNLLHYDESLDSSLVISATSSYHNVDAGATKEFIRRLKKRTNWRLPNEY